MVIWRPMNGKCMLTVGYKNVQSLWWILPHHLVLVLWICPWRAVSVVDMISSTSWCGRSGPTSLFAVKNTIQYPIGTPFHSVSHFYISIYFSFESWNSFGFLWAFLSVRQFQTFLAIGRALIVITISLYVCMYVYMLSYQGGNSTWWKLARIIFKAILSIFHFLAMLSWASPCWVNRGGGELNMVKISQDHFQAISSIFHFWPCWITPHPHPHLTLVTQYGLAGELNMEIFKIF